MPFRDLKEFTFSDLYAMMCYAKRQVDESQALWALAHEVKDEQERLDKIKNYGERSGKWGAIVGTVSIELDERIDERIKDVFSKVWNS